MSYWSPGDPRGKLREDLRSTIAVNQDLIEEVRDYKSKKSNAYDVLNGMDMSKPNAKAERNEIRELITYYNMRIQNIQGEISSNNHHIKWLKDELDSFPR